MTRFRSRKTSRSAFTLIELLVVIAIIAILVSLSAAAVMKVLGKIPEIQTRTDISEMDVSLATFMSDYQLSDPPPSYLILREDMSYPAHYGDPGTGPIELQSYQFLRRVFGKSLGPTDWNLNGKIDVNVAFPLQGQQCLVFYLGGVQTVATGTPQCLGFSTNNVNPAQVGGSRKGPYFNFLSSRLVLGKVQNPKLSAFFVYLDGWKPATSVQMPYAYFSSYGIYNKYNPFTKIPPPFTVAPFMGGDCANIAVVNGVNVGAYAYSDLGGVFTNPNKYQIISAGADGIFGFNPGPPPTTNPPASSASGTVTWNPSGGATGAGRDDQANFSSLILGAGQQ